MPTAGGESGSAPPDFGALCKAINGMEACFEEAKCDFSKLGESGMIPAKSMQIFSMCDQQGSSTGSNTEGGCNQLEAFKCASVLSTLQGGSGGAGADLTKMCPLMTELSTCLNKAQCSKKDMLDALKGMVGGEGTSGSGAEMMTGVFDQLFAMCEGGCKMEAFTECGKKAASALGMAEEPSQAVMCEKYPDIMGAYVTCAEQSSCGGVLKMFVGSMTNKTAEMCGPAAGKDMPPVEAAEFKECVGGVEVNGDMSCLDFEKVTTCWFEKGANTYGTEAVKRCNDFKMEKCPSSSFQCPTPTEGAKDGPEMRPLPTDVSTAIKKAEEDAENQMTGTTQGNTQEVTSSASSTTVSLFVCIAAFGASLWY